MKRLFWLGVGVASGVALSKKARAAKKQASPEGLAGSIGSALRELAGAIGSFGADVRAGMSERQEELADVVERRSGVSPLAGRALSGHPVQSAAAEQGATARRAARARDARAPRAND